MKYEGLFDWEPACDMNVFLVESRGVAAGFFNNFMKIYQSGTERINTDRRIIGESFYMKAYLAGGQSQLRKTIETTFSNPDYSLYTGAKILQSFSYADEFTEKQIIPKCSDFLLDSGAFTYFTSGAKCDWNKYIERYADFINRNHINRYFELDIDKLIGYEAVKKLRVKLEHLTEKQSIPVWHKSRGKDEFLRMCDEYNYVAIGGIVSREIKKDEEKYFPWFIDEAHKREAKIHALGYTNMSGLRKYKFDSVDSSSWVAGNRYGMIYKFTGNGIKQIKRPPNTKVSTNLAAINNFLEWKKFSAWAETHL